MRRTLAIAAATVREHRSIRGGVAVLGVFALWLLAVETMVGGEPVDRWRLRMRLVAVGIGLAASAAAVVVGASSLAEDRRRGRLDALLVRPVHAIELAAGKAAGTIAIGLALTVSLVLAGGGWVQFVAVREGVSPQFVRTSAPSSLSWNGVELEEADVVELGPDLPPLVLRFDGLEVGAGGTTTASIRLPIHPIEEGLGLRLAARVGVGPTPLGASGSAGSEDSLGSDSALAGGDPRDVGVILHPRRTAMVEIDAVDVGADGSVFLRIRADDRARVRGDASGCAIEVSRHPGWMGWVAFGLGMAGIVAILGAVAVVASSFLSAPTAIAAATAIALLGVLRPWTAELSYAFDRMAEGHGPASTAVAGMAPGFARAFSRLLGVLSWAPPIGDLSPLGELVRDRLPPAGSAWKSALTVFGWGGGAVLVAALRVARERRR